MSQTEMDTILCDELLQEIFHRLPPRSSSALSLVSKRWLRLLRSSTTSLSLCFSPHHDAYCPSMTTFFSHHPFLSSLSISTVSGAGNASGSYDHLLVSVATYCRNLRHLRFLTGPVSLFSLFSLPTSCPYLSSLTITLSRPMSFHWITLFSSLKDLSIFFTGTSEEESSLEFNSVRKVYADLQIENLCLSGIQAGDRLNWLWSSCNKLKKLQLKRCEGLGVDDLSIHSFVKCLKGLQEVEMRTCRSIVDGVLVKLAEKCISLNSLLIYDGGSKEGLLQFLSHSRCNLENLDLRLPLDLDNSHLLAMTENFRELSSLRLESCCLVTGEGVKRLGIGLGNFLEELALINCDVVEREPGLLTTLGQNLRKLKRFDLSYNEMLADKELQSMLASCNDLCELKLRGCSGLTNTAMFSIYKNCKQLESVDIMYCCGIEAEAVELFLLNSPYLKRMQVEQTKLSDAARKWASHKFIEVLS